MARRCPGPAGRVVFMRVPGRDRQGGFIVLKCCGRLIKPKRYTFTDEEGMHVLRAGKCLNESCAALVIEIEKISVFGRAEKFVLRGKKAKCFLEENRHRLLESKKYRNYKENTARGFHYCNSFWDLKKNKIRQEVRELATDRLISREEKDLLAV